MSGRVTLEVDNLTDYVIFDGKSPSQLLDRLGVRAFSDLPARTVCVRWDWVATCKRNASFMRALPRLTEQSKLLEPASWLCFKPDVPPPPRVRGFESGAHAYSRLTERVPIAAHGSTSISR